MSKPWAPHGDTQLVADLTEGSEGSEGSEGLVRAFGKDVRLDITTPGWRQCELHGLSQREEPTSSQGEGLAKPLG